MATITLQGPVVPATVANMVLRDALFHSPAARGTSTSNYHTIEVGISDGTGISWIGEWNQSTDVIAGGTPLSLLDEGRPGMRLRPAQSLVVRVTTTGVPQSLRGARVNFRLALVGGRDGPAKPLVASGVQSADANARVQIAALERQINEGGLSEWDDPVQLQDPDGTADEPAFAAEHDYDATDKTFVAAAGATAADVSITFTKPSWATTGKFILVAVFSMLGVTGTGASTLTIYDGSADQDALIWTTETARAVFVVGGYGGEITATTTYTPRVAATVNNVTATAQLILGFCAWA